MHSHDIGGAYISEAESNFCSLYGNPIGDRGAEALATAMKTMNLQTLSKAVCTISQLLNLILHPLVVVGVTVTITCVVSLANHIFI